MPANRTPSGTGAASARPSMFASRSRQTSSPARRMGSRIMARIAGGGASPTRGPSVRRTTSVVGRTGVPAPMPPSASSVSANCAITMRGTKGQTHVGAISRSESRVIASVCRTRPAMPNSRGARGTATGVPSAASMRAGAARPPPSASPRADRAGRSGPRRHHWTAPAFPPKSNRLNASRSTAHAIASQSARFHSKTLSGPIRRWFNSTGDQVCTITSSAVRPEKSNVCARSHRPRKSPKYEWLNCPPASTSAAPNQLPRGCRTSVAMLNSNAVATNAFGSIRRKYAWTYATERKGPITCAASSGWASGTRKRTTGTAAASIAATMNAPRKRPPR